MFMSTAEVYFIALKRRFLLRNMLEMIIVLSQKMFDLINQKKIDLYFEKYKMKHSCLKFGPDKIQGNTVTEGRMEI